jgi:thioesterase domain-containing protein
LIDVLRVMKPEERLGYVVAEGLRVGALPPGFTEMDGRRYIQVFYATGSAYLRYAPAPWPGRLTLFRTAAGAAAFSDPTLGWGAFAAEGVEIIDIPGDHITLVRPPHVEELADQILSHEPQVR